MEIKNFNAKYEAIEKMLRHWSYRTLNLEGRITITKSLALPKLTHLATVLPELDNQKAKKTRGLNYKLYLENLQGPDKQEICKSK